MRLFMKLSIICFDVPCTIFKRKRKKLFKWKAEFLQIESYRSEVIRVGSNPTQLMCLWQREIGTQGQDDDMKSLGGDGRLLAKKRAQQGSCLHSPSGGATPVDTVISDFQPPELWENTFWMFKPPCWWYFAMAVPIKLITILWLEQFFTEPYKNNSYLNMPQPKLPESQEIS